MQLDSQLEGLQKGEMAQFTLCNGHQLTDLVVLLLLIKISISLTPINQSVLWGTGTVQGIPFSRANVDGECIPLHWQGDLKVLIALTHWLLVGQWFCGKTSCPITQTAQTYVGTRRYWGVNHFSQSQLTRVLKFPNNIPPSLHTLQSHSLISFHCWGGGYAALPRKSI